MLRRVVPLLLLWACGRPGTPANAPAADTMAADTSAAASAATAPADSSAPERITFASTIADFQLAIPASWGRRYTVSERVEPSDYPKARHVVEFMYLPDEGGVPPTMLAIADYGLADWNAVKGSSRGQVVAEKGDRVWVAVPAEKTTPLTKGSPDEKRFEAARVTPAQVKSALTVR